MKRKLISRLRSRRGFTLGELLVTLLIIAMVTGVVAAGVPAAARAYTNAMDSANAQMLLSTTMTLLRDELSTAVIKSAADVTTSSISYTDAYGNRARLYVGEGTVSSGEGTGGSDDDAGSSDETASYPGIYIETSGASEGTGGTRLLVSREASGKASIYAIFSLPATDAYNKGLITFENVQVLSAIDDSTKVLAESGTFQIRVISYSDN